MALGQTQTDFRQGLTQIIGAIEASLGLYKMRIYNI
jgi:hypothetical protein